MKWNEYTWYSKWASLLFFILVLPSLTFYVGNQYQATKVSLENQQGNTFEESYSNLENNLQTYNQYNFSFKYPKDIKVYTNKFTFFNVGMKSSGDVVKEYDGFLILLGATTTVEKMGEYEWDNYSRIRAYVNKRPEPNSFNEWVTDRKDFFSTVYEDNSVQLVNVGKYQALKYEKPNLITHLFYNERTKEDVEIDLELRTPEEKVKYLQLYNQIVSTFQFTNTDIIQSKPYIKIISPNGGEILKTGQKYTIKWDTLEKLGVVKIEHLIGGHSRGIINYGELTPVSAKQYIWTVPGSFGTDGSQENNILVIWLTDDDEYDNPIVTISQDKSDATFTITK